MIMISSLHHVICTEKDWKGIKMLPEYNTLISHFGNQKHRSVLNDGLALSYIIIVSIFIINCMIFLSNQFLFIIDCDIFNYAVTPITILLGIWKNIK